MALIDNLLTKTAPSKFGGSQILLTSALGSIGAGASMFASTGLVVPSVVVAAIGGVVAYSLTNNIPRNGA